MSLVFVVEMILWRRVALARFVDSKGSRRRLRRLPPSHSLGLTRYRSLALSHRRTHTRGQSDEPGAFQKVLDTYDEDEVNRVLRLCADAGLISIEPLRCDRVEWVGGMGGWMGGRGRSLSVWLSFFERDGEGLILSCDRMTQCANIFCGYFNYCAWSRVLT